VVPFPPGGGADLVARSPADGRTLMSSTASLSEKNVHQFAPVTLVSASPYVVVVSSKTKPDNVAELIAFARANPGKLTFGSSGTGARRPETLADLPTVAESGLPGYEALGWFGLLAPAATPKPIVEKLSAEASRVLSDAEIRTRMQAVGALHPRRSGEWAKLMREAGIKTE
jgi:tripartite-type tricarboxylate transporter receptor subunit TctC